jgi:hypothetical protein
MSLKPENEKWFKGKRCGFMLATATTNTTSLARLNCVVKNRNNAYLYHLCCLDATKIAVKFIFPKPFSFFIPVPSIISRDL